MKIYYLFVLACLLSLPVLAQQKEDAPPPGKKSELNKYDAKGKKDGTWFTTKEPRMGEPGVNEFGNYDHGVKVGNWYKVDNGGDLVSIEGYRNDVLDGEAKYYDQGRLYCVGHYRGLNPKNKFDTIVVMHPVTQEEEYKVIPTDIGSMRHGTWKYYNPATGGLIKEEEYQVDELVFHKEYEVSSTADSVYMKKREAMLPHNRGLKSNPPPGKKVSYTEY